MSLSIGELVGYVDLDAGPAEAAADKIGGMFDKLGGTWGKVLGGAGVAAGAAFATSLVGAINLEPSRDRVAAALDLTKEQAKRAGEVSAGLYADAWGESAEEVDAAVEAVMSSIKGMRNASQSDLAKTTEAALTLATTMQVDVVRAAQVAGNMVSNGMAKNGTDAIDLLSKALSKVPVQLREDVMDAADEYGQFFNQLGIKGPQAMGMLAAGAKKGMYGIDKAGDAVKEFTIRATDGSAATKGAMDTIGLSAGDMADKILKGGDQAHGATQKIITGLLNIEDPSKRANAAIALFGTPLEDIGTKDIPAFLRSLRDGGKGMDDWRGTTKRMGSTLNDNARTNLTEFTRSIKMGFIDLIGGKVLPVVTDITGKLNTGLGPAFDVVGDAVSSVTGFLSEHTTVATTLVGIIAALAAITAVHSAVLAVGAAGGLTAWLTGTKLVSGATKVWAAMQWLLNTALAANPIVLVVIAIAALVAGFILAYKKSEQFRAIVNGALNAVKDAGQAVGRFFKDTVPGWFSDGWQKIKNGATSVVDWIKGIPGKIGALGSKFGTAGKDLLQGFIDGMKNAAGVISGIAGNVWDAVKGLLNGAIGKINTALEFKIGLPGKDLTINPPDIPKLATGGRATAATLAVIGEGREAESVLPDSVLRGLLEKAHAAGAASGQAGDGKGDTWNITTPGADPGEVAEHLWFLTRTRG